VETPKGFQTGKIWFLFKKSISTRLV